MISLTPHHQLYLDSVTSWSQLHANDSFACEQLELYQNLRQVLGVLDLGPALPVLKRGYSSRFRGTPAKDPLAMLRFMLLGILIDRPGPNRLVPLVRRNPVLRALCGFQDVDGKASSPGVGTVYDFMNRLVDGPLRFTPGAERPSRILTERTRTPMTREERKSAKEEEKMRVKGKSPKAESTEEKGRLDDVTKQLRERLKESLKSPLGECLATRLLEILDLVAVRPSAERGLLGDPTKLDASGDGSPLESATNGHGTRVPECPHRANERCDCPRTWSDPDAASGWDSYRKSYFYGYNFYEIVCVEGERALPLIVSLSPGGTHDQVAAMKDLSTLKRYYQMNHRAWSLTHFIGDKGHDGGAFSAFLLEDLGTIPIIPLCSGSPKFHPKHPELALSAENAVPLCEGNVEMASWGSPKPGVNLFICPVKAGKRERCPISREGEPSHDCRPGKKHAPVVKVMAKDSARLFPPVARNSKAFRTLYRKRTTSERSNAIKKGAGGVHRSRYRRSTWLLIQLYLIAILQHAKTWVAVEAKAQESQTKANVA